jgi:hypothetical protein
LLVTDGRSARAASSFNLLQIFLHYYALYLALAFAWFAVVGAIYGDELIRQNLAFFAAALTALAALPFFPTENRRGKVSIGATDVVHSSATPSDYLGPSSLARHLTGLLPPGRSGAPKFAVLVPGG